jgi:hypothetical protein
MSNGVFKNITVSVDGETYRRARIRAAELNTSVSAMVRKYLVDVSSGVSQRASADEFERLKELQREVQSRVTNFDANDRLSRDELHDRKRL